MSRLSRPVPRPKPEVLAPDEITVSDPLRYQIETVIDKLVFSPAPRKQNIQTLFDKVAAKEGTSRTSTSQSKDPESHDFSEQMAADMRLGDLLTALVHQVRTEVVQMAYFMGESEIETSHVVATVRSVLRRMLKSDEDCPVRHSPAFNQHQEMPLSMTS